MQVQNVLHAACWKHRTQKIAKNSAHHRKALLGCIFAAKACIDSWKKNLLNSNVSSICLYNMVNFGPLTAEISLPGRAPQEISYFQRVSHLGFVCAPTSLSGGQPNFAWCLAVSCACTLYIHFWRLLPPNGTARCKIHFASKSCVLLYWQHHCTALEQWALAKLCGVVSPRNRAPIPLDIR